MWAQNNRYLPVCYSCIDELFEHYSNVLGSVEAGVHRLCMKFDIYYDKNLFENTVAGTYKNLFRAYVARTSLAYVQGKTYDDTLDIEAGIPFDTPNEFARFDITEKPKTASQRQIDEWGDGFTASEYSSMDGFYKDLTRFIDNNNVAKESLIRDLCKIRIQQDRALKRDDTSSYEKLTKLYQTTLANPALRTEDDQAIGYQDGLGKWVQEIEHYCPADYFADKSKYWDFFGIGEYIQRFIYRPLKNLMTGSRDKDPEYVVGDDDAG